MYIPELIIGWFIGVASVFIIGYIIYKKKGWDKEDGNN